MSTTSYTNQNSTLKDGISVIVCTYNGAGRLPKTLDYLANQIFNPNLNWEVIVIDNSSSDSSAIIATQEWDNHNNKKIGFKCMIEPTPGKINAMATGVLQSKYCFFINCDDDNWLSPNYVQNAYDLLKSDESIGAVGGLSIATTDGQELPTWFETYQCGYAVGPQGEQKGDISKRGYLFGAGMATKTELFNLAYAKLPTMLVGRQENKLTAGDDSEYCQRLILMGYKLVYDPDMYLYHYMPLNRLTESYRLLLYEGLAESNFILDKYRLITQLKLKVEKHSLEWLRLVIITPFRILFTTSLKKKTKRINTLRYLLKLDYPNDPILQSIVKFEKNFVSS
ncbi:glycosyltransferase [Pedobacter frigiditerrae]|uniref:glycosyltransferase n=1 Tax=Pedobacter frigiditerrae TaxID=2530452 RepID=UPI00292D87FD|nr:glycosyltransferase [Pedobacter frigiditerrae]